MSEKRNSTKKPLFKHLQSVSEVLTAEKGERMQLLLAIEMAILDWGYKNRALLKQSNARAVEYIGRAVGFKSNYLEQILAERKFCKISVEATQKIYEITGDERILNELISFMKRPRENWEE